MQKYLSQTKEPPNLITNFKKQITGLRDKENPMSGKLKKDQLRVLIGNPEDLISEAIEEFIEKIISDEFGLSVTSVWSGEDILKFAKEYPVDIFIIVTNNIIFRSEDLSAEHRIEKALQLVQFLRNEYKRPVIALYGWPDDPLFPEKAKQFGATFCIKLPPTQEEFQESIEMCMELIEGT
jgi:hypothetical protein